MSTYAGSTYSFVACTGSMEGDADLRHDLNVEVNAYNDIGITLSCWKGEIGTSGRRRMECSVDISHEDFLMFARAYVASHEGVE